MKILWFTNIPMPAMLHGHNRDHAASGGWMMALLEQLAKAPDINISVACASPRLPKAGVITENNVRFHPISQGPSRRLFGVCNPDNAPQWLDACEQVVHEVSPDIIHIHGSERFYGLLGVNNRVSAPIVISLQGLLHDYAKWRHYFGVTPIKDIVANQCHFNALTGRGPIFDYWKFCRSAKREVIILEANRYFMGRTMWDHAHLETVNPQARYFHVNELLRPAFHRKQWNMEACRRHRILFTNANTFRRGAEILIDAIAILRRSFYDVTLALAGGVERLPYGKCLLRRISRLGLQDAVEFLGTLTEEQMSNALCESHVFTITSLLENSPNSLCEAQLVGLPCVASYAGGIPSLVDEGITGLFFPSGDASVLAERIKEIFSNDDLAKKLGNQARNVAIERHNPESVARCVLETYQTIISMTRNDDIHEY